MDLYAILWTSYEATLAGILYIRDVFVEFGLPKQVVFGALFLPAVLLAFISRRVVASIASLMVCLAVALLLPADYRPTPPGLLLLLVAEIALLMVSLDALLAQRESRRQTRLAQTMQQQISSLEGSLERERIWRRASGDAVASSDPKAS